MTQDSPTPESGRGVSPVVGVILLIAITVAMGSVVGGFLVGTDLPNPAPVAAVEAGDANDELVYAPDKSPAGDGDDILYLEHRAGEPIAAEHLKIVVAEVNGTQKLVDDDLTEPGLYVASMDSHTTQIVCEMEDDPNYLAAGERIRLTERPDSDLDLPGGAYEIRLRHTQSNSVIDERTVVLQ